MIIGMRNFKTAIAVFLCVVISNCLKVEYPFYVAIAAVVAMQNSVTGSIKTGGHRMLGTFVGALAGMLCALVIPGNPFMSALGIIVVIYLCNRLKWNESIAIASIVFCAIMLNVKENNAVTYSVNRLLDTFIGITIAIIVNLFIFPPNHLKILKEKNEELKMIVHDFIKEKIVFSKSVDMSLLNDKIEKLQNEINICMSENQLKKGESEEIFKTKEMLECYRTISLHLGVVNDKDWNCSINEKGQSELNKFFKSHISSCKEVINDDYIIYNYHVDKIIEVLNKL